MPMISSRGRQRLAALALLGGALLAQHASAVCRISDKDYIAQDVSLDMGKVVILPSTPIGGVIAEKSVRLNNPFYAAACPLGGGSFIAEYVNARQRQEVSTLSNVYETDIAGVGIRVMHLSRVGKPDYYPFRGFFRLIALYFRDDVMRVQLIKTGAHTGSGQIAPPGKFTTYYYDGDGPSRPFLTSSFSGSGTTIISPTCEVESGSRNIIVDFGDVAKTAFNGIGSRAADRDFQIRLKCSGKGDWADQIGISIRVDGERDVSGLPGVLRLSAAPDSAAGVGIQLVSFLQGIEQPVELGKSIYVDKLGQFDNYVTVPLRARYIQTRAGSVGVGIANGKATFTLEYH
ncbi:fimbrial protein [Stenotrophomonas maltophilia]|uniref:fimbrial protein n=1 Tax=Stenotrophomonas maltophilia TaxID=40324 RepID=UPI0028B23787|nr:fimbrial protein [Stenotrophomonas geniculata]